MNPLVLIADNDAAVNQLLAGMLRARDLRCEEVHDGEAALARLRDAGEGSAGRVDVLVTDLDMPKLSGEELVRRLAELPAPPCTIVISGYLDAKLEASLREAPAVVEVLRKPFDVMEFAELVDGIARGGRRGRETEQGA